MARLAASAACLLISLNARFGDVVEIPSPENSRCSTNPLRPPIPAALSVKVKKGANGRRAGLETTTRLSPLFSL